MTRPHLQIVLNECDVPNNLKQALSTIDAAVSYTPLREVCEHGVTRQADAVVIVPGPEHASARPAMEHLLGLLAERPRATLVMTDSSAEGLDELRRPQSLPVGFVNGVGAHELAGRLATMIDYSRALADSRPAELRLQARQAVEIQRAFLPPQPPRLPGFRLHALYRPAQELSGDIYGFEQPHRARPALWLADVCGQGLPAAMITGFVKRCLSATPRHRPHRPIGPDAILRGLNDDLLAQQFAGGDFVAAGYATIDQSGHVVWARGGLPYPILVRPDRRPELIKSGGCVLGAVAQPDLELPEVSLNPGDALIFYTDGLPALLCDDRAAAETTFLQTKWFKSLGTAPVPEQLAVIERLCQSWPASQRDDLTVLVIERTRQPG